MEIDGVNCLNSFFIGFGSILSEVMVFPLIWRHKENASQWLCGWAGSALVTSWLVPRPPPSAKRKMPRSGSVAGLVLPSSRPGWRPRPPRSAGRKMPHSGSVDGLALPSSRHGWCSCPTLSAERKMPHSCSVAGLVLLRHAVAGAHARHLVLKEKCLTVALWMGWFCSVTPWLVPMPATWR